jgi:hypothetical protein
MGDVAHAQDEISLGLLQARKAATSAVGRSEMKPTVSDRITRAPAGELQLAHGGMSVWNTWSLADTAAQSGG